MIDKLIKCESMRLEQYATLLPSMRKKIDYKLSQNEKERESERTILDAQKNNTKVEKVKDITFRF